MSKVKLTSLFCLVLFLLTVIKPVIISANEWYKGGTLHEASIKQWNNATYNNKLATCAGFIIATLNDGYFLHDGKINSDNPIKRLSEILVENTDEYVKIANNKDEPISKIVLQAMLELGWIKHDYLTFLAKSAHTTPSSNINEVTYTNNTSKENSNRKHLPVKHSTTQNVKVRKYRRMSPAEGRKWVKKNIIPVITFVEDELVDRFDKYEKSATSLSNNKTLIKYYFKHINITFFVVQEDQTIIGFSDGKGFLK